MEQLAFSVEDFCRLNNISRAFFYKIVSQGKGPRLMKVGRRTLVSSESAADWRVQMEKEGYSEDE